MRIAMPSEHQSNPLAHLADNFSREIVTAAIAFSMAGYQNSKLSLREFEGARARTAEINGCQVCQAFRAGRHLAGYFDSYGGNVKTSVATRGPAPGESFYRNVSHASDDPQYSERERVAIAYAERLAFDPHGVATDEAFWARAKAVFSDDEIVDLSYNIASWIGFGRITHALGLDTVCVAVPMEQTA